MLRDHTLASVRRELPQETLRIESGRDLERLAGGGRWAAVWIQLDSLDGIDSAAVAEGVLRKLVSGGRLVTVIPGAWPLARLLERALRGKGEALGSLRARFDATSGSSGTPAGPACWRRCFEPGIAWIRSRALGLLVPPLSGVEGLSPLALGLLASAEAVVAGRWPARSLGAWTLDEGVRR